MLIDPCVHNSGFHEQIAALRRAVDEQGNTRLPGTGFELPDAVALEPEIWAQLNALAGQ